MATFCSSFARGKMYRLTRLDDCGLPVEGATSTVTTKGWVSVGVAPVYQEQEEITTLDSNGDICLDDQSDPAFRWQALTITLCNIDPWAVNIITGDPVVTNDVAPTPDTTGWRIDQAVTGSGKFALEMWVGIPGQPCDLAGFPEYGYILLPFVVQAQHGEFTVANAAINYTFTARTSSGSAWGVGPYDVYRDATTPATLEPLRTPITATQHMHVDRTSAPLPTPACGATALPVVP